MSSASVRSSRSCTVVAVNAATLALVGCTTVRIESALDPAAVRVVRHWGVVGVELPDTTPSYVADISSIGFARNPFGWTVGYAKQGWAALGDDCRLVVWVASREHLEAARELADTHAGLCTVAAP